MKLDFDFATVAVTEFGVGRDDGEGERFLLVPVDGEAQSDLREIVATTWRNMQELEPTPRRYEPAEKHAPSEHFYLPIGDDLAERVRAVHQANNLTVAGGTLSDPANVFCYFVRMTDGQGRRLTGLRRANQFKGILKSRLLRFVSDALTLVEDDVFKLDNDFDLLIDASNVHILHPSGFEFVGHLQDAVLRAVPENGKAVQGDLTFVEFASIQTYALKHARAARLLASIRSQDEGKRIDKASLKRHCKTNGIEI